MSFNIRHNNAADEAQGLGWPARRDRVLALVNCVKPDVLGVQEASTSQMEDLCAGLRGYESYGVRGEDDAEGSEYAAVFYRKDKFCSRDAETFWLSPTPQEPSQGWDAAYPRVASKIKLIEMQTGRDLTVWNTRLDNRGEQARQESARWLRGQLCKSKGPALLVGDMNSLPYSEPYRLLLEDNLLQDAFAASAMPPQGPEGTYRGFRGVARRGARIDYIFANQGFWVLSYKVPDSYYKEGPPPSDHFPVVAELKFR